MFLANIRRRWQREWLTKSESLMLSLFVALLAMAFAVILILALSNRSLLQQHTVLLKDFNAAVAKVEQFGQNIVNLLKSLEGKGTPPG